MRRLDHMTEKRWNEVETSSFESSVLVLSLDRLQMLFVACLAVVAHGLTPWEVLGLPETASLLEIKRSYRRLAAVEHPDTARDAAERRRKVLSFQRISEAYRELRVEGRWKERRKVEKAWEEWKERRDLEKEELEKEFEEVQVDSDSFVPFFAIAIWVAIFVVLSSVQDSLTWDYCQQQWQWWCYLKGA